MINGSEGQPNSLTDSSDPTRLDFDRSSIAESDSSTSMVSDLEWLDAALIIVCFAASSFLNLSGVWGI